MDNELIPNILSGFLISAGAILVTILWERTKYYYDNRKALIKAKIERLYNIMAEFSDLIPKNKYFVTQIAIRSAWLTTPDALSTPNRTSSLNDTRESLNTLLSSWTQGCTHYASLCAMLQSCLVVNEPPRKRNKVEDFFHSMNDWSLSASYKKALDDDVKARFNARNAISNLGSIFDWINGLEPTPEDLQDTLTHFSNCGEHARILAEMTIGTESVDPSNSVAHKHAKQLITICNKVNDLMQTITKLDPKQPLTDDAKRQHLVATIQLGGDLIDAIFWVILNRVPALVDRSIIEDS